MNKIFLPTTHSSKSLPKLKESAHYPRETKRKGATSTPTPKSRRISLLPDNYFLQGVSSLLTCTDPNPNPNPRPHTKATTTERKETKRKENIFFTLKTSRFLNCTSRQPLSKHLKTSHSIPRKTSTTSSPRKHVNSKPMVLGTHIRVPKQFPPRTTGSKPSPLRTKR